MAARDPGDGADLLNAVWVSIVFGIFSTRYRDIAPILSSITLMLFVLTPIMWTTQILRGAGRRRSPSAPSSPS